MKQQSTSTSKFLSESRTHRLFLLLDALFPPAENDDMDVFRMLTKLKAYSRYLPSSNECPILRKYLSDSGEYYNGSSNADMNPDQRFVLSSEAVRDEELRLALNNLCMDKEFLDTRKGRALAETVAIFQNSETVFRELVASDDPGRGTVQARWGHIALTWFSKSWLASRSPYLQRVIVTDMICAFCIDGIVHPTLPAAMNDVVEGKIVPMIQLELVEDVLFWMGYQGKMPKSLSELDYNSLRRESSLAMRAFFFSNGTQAIEHCENCFKMLRTQMRLRGPIYIGQVMGLALYLVRFAYGESASRGELSSTVSKLSSACLTGLSSQTFGILGFAGLSALDLLRRGCEQEARDTLLTARHSHIDDKNYISALIWYAACVRLGADTLTVNEIIQWHKRVNEFPLLARAFSDLLHEAQPDNKLWNRDRTTPADFFKLTDLVPQMEHWQFRLLALENLASENERKEKQKRLVWILDPEHDNVEVLQQILGAKGWSKGRSLSLHKLSENSAEMNWMSARDRSVISYIQKSYSWWSPHASLRLSNCCEALEGHSTLFIRVRDKQTREVVLKPVTLRRERLVFQLEENRKKHGYRLTMGDLNAQMVKENGVIFVEDRDEIIYYKLDEREQQLLRLMGTGLEFPETELARVLNLTRSSLNIAMRTDSVKAESVDPSTTPVVQLEQTRDGFSATLGVRPFGRPDTMFFPTGEGALEPLATVPLESGPQALAGEADGGTKTADKSQLSGLSRTLRVTRDFAAENAAMENLIAHCPSLAAGMENRRWSTGDIEDVLNLLEELRSCGVDNSVEWPRGQRLRLRGSLDSKNVKIKIGWAKNDWFDVSGGAQLDENRFVSLKAMLSMLKGSRFVSLGDGEYVALTDDLRRRLSSLKLVSVEGKKDSMQINSLAAAAVEQALGDMDLVVDEKWNCSIDRMHEAFATTPRVPQLLKADLREYQREGYEWMQRLAIWGVGACLADDMGLGKTLQSIAVMLNQATKGPCLVVAPTSVCGNWELEIERFAPSLNTHRLGHTKRRETIEALGAGDVLIVGYGLLPNVQNDLSSRTWSMIVFDEAQALKNAHTRRAKAGHKLQGDFRLALTGTPIENRIDDLWSLFNIINPGLLGSWDNFCKRYGQAAPGSSASRSLRAVVRPFLLRRLKSAVLDELPQKTEQNLIVEPNEKELAFYEAMRRKAVEKITGEDAADTGSSRRFQILAELTRLRRACCHPGLADPDMMALEKYSSKTEHFLELVSELVAGGHKILAFSQFTSYLEQIRAALDERGFSWQYLDGSTPEKDRRARVAAFQRGEGDVFLLSLKAGGTGINLTAADYVIHLDPWWNPAVEDQASDRAHRIGQQRPVTIYRMVQSGSVEEKILALHATKRELAADFLEGTESGVTSLTEEDLLNLMR